MVPSSEGSEREVRVCVVLSFSVSCSIDLPIPLHVLYCVVLCCRRGLSDSGKGLTGVPDKCRVVGRLLRGGRAGPAVTIVK